MENKFIINTDGGSRGNPGHAAIGVIIRNAKGKLLKKYGKYIGKATNNEAEYRAAISALKTIITDYGEKTAKESIVELSTDSELLVKQMNLRYKVKRSNIKPLFSELCRLKESFFAVKFFAIPREENQEADKLVNEELDRRR